MRAEKSGGWPVRFTAAQGESFGLAPLTYPGSNPDSSSRCFWAVPWTALFTTAVPPWVALLTFLLPEFFAAIWAFPWKCFRSGVNYPRGFATAGPAAADKLPIRASDTLTRVYFGESLVASGDPPHYVSHCGLTSFPRPDCLTA